MVSKRHSNNAGGFRSGQLVPILRALALGLLLILCSTPAPAQKNSLAPKPSKQSTRSTKPGDPALPAAIQVANGESIPVSELVPRTESATKHIEQMVSSIHNPEIKQAEASLDDLSKAVSETAEETKRIVRLARSPLQLTEARVTWTRHHDQLDAINQLIVGYATSLDQQNQELLKIGETWTAAAKSVVDAKLPEQFVQRVVGVQLLASQGEETLRSETDRLMKVQVQISQTRNQIDDVIDLLNATEAALRDQLFVIDSQPIWRVLTVSDFRDGWQQVPQRIKGAGARTGRFYQVYRSKLLLYLLFAIGLLAVVFTLSRQDRTSWPPEDSAQIESLRHPLALAAFVLLVLFALLFAKAPGKFCGFPAF